MPAPKPSTFLPTGTNTPISSPPGENGCLLMSATLPLRRALAVFSALTLALMLSALMPGSAMAGKAAAMKVGDVSSPASCSITVPVTNPNRTAQTVEVGVKETTTGASSYVVVAFKAGESKNVVLSSLASGSYKGFAANSAGRTYSANEASTVC